MIHRHIEDLEYSLPAIDSIIERGKRGDWAALQIAVRSDPDICRKVLRIARHNLEHPYTNRYHFLYRFAIEQLKCQTAYELTDKEVFELAGLEVVNDTKIRVGEDVG